MKTCFSDAKQTKKCQKNTLCKECTYVQKYWNESDENFDSFPNNKPTFPSSYFHEDPIVNVGTVEETIK